MRENLALRFASTCILLISALIISPGGASAAPIDVCGNSGTIQNLIGLIGTITEPVEGNKEDFCTVTATNLLALKTIQVTFFEPDKITVSDRLGIQNNANGQLVICFESDDFAGSTRCAVKNPDMNELVDEGTISSTSVGVDLSLNGKAIAEVIASSDCDPTTMGCVPSTVSDRLRIVSPPSPPGNAKEFVLQVIPEPTSIALLSAALLSLGGAAVRLRRR